MDELLRRVLEAHGGLGNWAAVTKMHATLSVDGPFWDWRGWPQIRRPQSVTLDPRREHITFTPFTGEGTTGVFDTAPEKVQLLGADGHVEQQRDDPRRSFPAYTDSVAWDPLHLAYFMGTANWNYLTAPFLFTYPGVEARETGPWKENGQTWRRLAVRFPPDLPNHNPHQMFYYDDDHLLRRMDYSPDVTGNSLIAHYTHDPQQFDGFVFYTRRTVHLRNSEGIADRSFAPITIDTSSVSLHR